ncbi:hypothetical protein WG70_22975 [Burkholderia oklahomensis EO147]|nr:hypothetical protein WG70_22975 [Burkholderia oklahomensis EO147]KUY54745.1 hypothetical protein WI23_21900 [Burkholderia oklahomensis C6786]KUY68736.1 hypothetical protein WG70_24475 [Burkholderia oklahomensis EO147]
MAECANAACASQAAYRCEDSTGCAGWPLPVSRLTERAIARSGTERAHTIAQRRRREGGMPTARGEAGSRDSTHPLRDAVRCGADRPRRIDRHPPPVGRSGAGHGTSRPPRRVRAAFCPP